jgi:cell wall-associated protease
MRIIISTIFFFVFNQYVVAQQKTGNTSNSDLKGWHLLDKDATGYYGISLDKAYELLKGRKGDTVVVAVIDSGIDTLQEDLKPILWTNKKEKQGNKVDDDGNGYTDDYYGWNFCGSKEGENLAKTSTEAARVYHGWKEEFEEKKERNIPADKKFLFQQWKVAKGIIEEKYKKAKKDIENVTYTFERFEDAAKRIKYSYQLKSFTYSDLLKINLANATQTIQLYVANWKRVMEKDILLTDSAFIKDGREYLEKMQRDIDNYSKAPDDKRILLTKDNYASIDDRIYGNNNLKGSSNEHGTLVAGTIAALRSNGIGSNGIINNVQIMAVRAVPDGDECDKDIALAIRYAVDNGAQIINMSFGKQVSPYKNFVDDAIRYAESKGVLIIHAAGNDAKDISKTVYYPSAIYLDGKKASNIIIVGASAPDNTNGDLTASFSNYSKEYVDIFAPGVKIYSTSMNNTYESVDGTSFASPVVSGVAALLKSYFPKITTGQIIEIILMSGTSISEEVKIPGDEKSKETSFTNLCVSGKIINAYGAVKMALQWEAEKRF